MRINWTNEYFEELKGLAVFYIDLLKRRLNNEEINLATELTKAVDKFLDEIGLKDNVDNDSGSANKNEYIPSNIAGGLKHTNGPFRKMGILPQISEWYRKRQEIGLDETIEILDELEEQIEMQQNFEDAKRSGAEFIEKYFPNYGISVTTKTLPRKVIRTPKPPSQDLRINWSVEYFEELKELALFYIGLLKRKLKNEKLSIEKVLTQEVGKYLAELISKEDNYEFENYDYKIGNIAKGLRHKDGPFRKMGILPQISEWYRKRQEIGLDETIEILDELEEQIEMQQNFEDAKRSGKEFIEKYFPDFGKSVPTKRLTRKVTKTTKTRSQDLRINWSGEYFEELKELALFYIGILKRKLNNEKLSIDLELGQAIDNFLEEVGLKSNIDSDNNTYNLHNLSGGLRHPSGPLRKMGLVPQISEWYRKRQEIGLDETIEILDELEEQIEMQQNFEDAKRSGKNFIEQYFLDYTRDRIGQTTERTYNVHRIPKNIQEDCINHVNKFLQFLLNNNLDGLLFDLYTRAPRTNIISLRNLTKKYDLNKIEILEEQGLIDKIDLENEKYVRITERGFKFLENISHIYYQILDFQSNLNNNEGQTYMSEVNEEDPIKRIEIYLQNNDIEKIKEEIVENFSANFLMATYKNNLLPRIIKNDPSFLNWLIRFIREYNNKEKLDFNHLIYIFMPYRIINNTVFRMQIKTLLDSIIPPDQSKDIYEIINNIPLKELKELWAFLNKNFRTDELDPFLYNYIKVKLENEIDSP